MKKSELTIMPAYFDRYINLNEDVTIIEALEISLAKLQNAPLDKWQELGNKVYAVGKWTVNDILQHIIDTERVFMYRALCFARGLNQSLSFDEDSFAHNAEAINRSLSDLVDELIDLRKSTIQLFKSFTTPMLEAVGMGFKGEYNVASIGFIIAGHQYWHVKVLEERYYPLLV
jgi:hypothetical protein